MVSNTIAVIADILIALMPVVIIAIGTAIYYNRRKVNKLYQRLFGLNEDDIDDGYMIEIQEQLSTMDGKLDELNHQRIQDLEVQLDSLNNEVDQLSERLKVEEQTDDRYTNEKKDRYKDEKD